MARYQEFTPDHMTDHQRAVYDDIVSGPRGRIYGPFLVLMHNPGLASALQKSGAYVRWQSSLAENLKELAIAIIGRYWGAHVEWSVHAKLAVDAGVDGLIVEGGEGGGAEGGGHEGGGGDGSGGGGEGGGGKGEGGT